MEDIEIIEKKILEIAKFVLKDISYEIPLSFVQLNNHIPYKSFNEFKNELNSGNILIQKFNLGIKLRVIKLFSNKISKMKIYFYLIMLYLSPILSIILSFKYSLLWLLGVIFFPIVFLKLMKKLYSSFLYYAGSNSEVAFSYLFFLREISLVTGDFQTTYYWKKNI